MNLKGKRILVTGGGGFLGTWVVEKLKKENVKEIIVPRSSNSDLREKKVCEELVKNVDVVFHLAAFVGGIGLNEKYPGKLFYDNAIMGIQLMEAARQAQVKKMLVVGTACSYPKYCPVPFLEEDIWSGYPDETTGIYGMAKKMLLVQAQAYRKEYGFSCIYIIPSNLYGPKDNFEEKYGHVIPSLIKRMVVAKEKSKKHFYVWGSGSATREFLYIEDAAEGLILAMKKYNGLDPLNLGTGNEISIKEVVDLMQKLIGYEGLIVWDIYKPDGQPRRALNITKAKSKLGFIAKTTLDTGLKTTIDWYLRNR